MAGEQTISYWVELDGVGVVIGSSSDSGECSKDELGRGVPFADQE